MKERKRNEDIISDGCVCVCVFERGREREKTSTKAKQAAEKNKVISAYDWPLSRLYFLPAE